MSFTVYAPATMANIAVGFDLLGAALAPIDGSLLGDTVTICSADKGIQLRVTGPWAHKLPHDLQRNIVYQCAVYFLKALGKVDQGVTLTLEKNLPVGSGLGSSASSVVAALYALNHHFGQPYSQQALLAMMGKFEGKISGSVHYDNVAPCYLGGTQLMLGVPDTFSEALPSFQEWYWVVAYSGASLLTTTMRDLLPKQYSAPQTIDFGRYLAAFVHASHQQNAPLAMSVLQDVLAEPYRASYIPGYLEAKAALSQLGMLATGISGSGPSLFTITDDLETAHAAQAWLSKHYVTEVGGFAHVCRLDMQGTRCVE